VNEQIVYLGPDTTDFSEPCEACLSVEEGSLAVRHRAVYVEGSLRKDVDVGFRTCRRGHRIVVRRVRLPANLRMLTW
jgi:hypothetical protein